MSTAARLGLPAPWQARVAGLHRWWQQANARDRALIGLALALAAAAALWLLAIAPAWHTLRTAPAKIDLLQLQLQQMQRLATEADELRAAPALTAEQSATALKAASDRLGARARLSLQGERATLTLSGVSSAQLREWLLEARGGARARPIEAQLSRSAQGFNGSIVLVLGGAP